jgi:hypothetical protein
MYLKSHFLLINVTGGSTWDLCTQVKIDLDVAVYLGI